MKKKTLSKPLQSLAAIVQKNLRLLMRAKTSALVVIAGPLVLMLLAGLAFDNADPYQVKVGVYSQNYNQLSESFVAELGEKSFDVITFEDKQTCEESIKTGDTHACVIFPADFEIGAPSKNGITFAVDFSKLNLVYNIIHVFEEQVADRSSEVRQELTTDLIAAVQESKSHLAKNKPLLVGLATNAQTAASTHTQVVATFGNINFNAPQVPTNISIEERVNTLTEETLAALNQSILLVNQLKLNETDNQTLAEYETLLADLTNLSVSISEQQNQTLSDAREVQQASNEIVTHLGTVQQQMQSVTSSARTKLEQVDTILDDSQNLVLQLQSSIDTMGSRLEGLELRDSAIVEPFESIIKPVAPQQTYLSYLFPLLLMLVLIFSALLITPTLIQLEQLSPARFRNKLSGAHPLAFFGATFLTSFGLVSAQLLLVLGIALIFFKGTLVSSIIPLLLVMLLATASFVLLGMAIGFVFTTETTAIIASVMASSALLFTSNTILPLESMPKLLGSILAYNPLTVGELLLRNIFVHGTSLVDLAADIGLIVGIFVLFLALALASYFYRNR